MALTLLSASCGGADTPNAGVGWGTLPDEVSHARAEAFWTAAEAVGVSRDRFFAEAKDRMHDALCEASCVVSALAPAARRSGEVSPGRLSCTSEAKLAL